MSIFSQFALQQAIYQQLTGDGMLAGMVSGVYDRPPTGTAYPYVTLGDAQGSDWSTKTTSGMEYHMPLYIRTREGGRAQAATIMSRAHDLLHQAALSVSGQSLASLRVIASDVSAENDGLTYRGMLQLRALLMAN